MTVKLSVSGAVARLCIDNPPLNILTNGIRRSLFDAVAAIETRPEIRVLVVEAAGQKAFSVGSDVREFPKEELGGLAKIQFEQYLLNRLAALPCPVIAKLRGLVLGGGAELMLACDIRIAAARSEFGFPEIRLGALPAAGGIHRLVREVGPLLARELIFRGKPISAERALAIGLITQLVADAELDAEVDRLAAELAALPRDAIRLAKHCIARALPETRIDTVEAEAFASLYRSRDLAEGLLAFQEKRQPRFDP